MKKLLFICSRNKWRSPTAETLWRKEEGYQVRSAGTSPRAKRKVSVDDIRWADIVFVMEQKHKNRLVAEFTRLLNHKPVHVLDIPDDYQYMDDDLIVELRNSISPILKLI